MFRSTQNTSTLKQVSGLWQDLVQEFKVLFELIVGGIVAKSPY